MFVSETECQWSAKRTSLDVLFASNRNWVATITKVFQRFAVTDGKLDNKN